LQKGTVVGGRVPRNGAIAPTPMFLAGITGVRGRTSIRIQVNAMAGQRFEVLGILFEKLKTFLVLFLVKIKGIDV
jgi:hypothetical protein